MINFHDVTIFILADIYRPAGFICDSELGKAKQSLLRCVAVPGTIGSSKYIRTIGVSLGTRRSMMESNNSRPAGQFCLFLFGAGSITADVFQKNNGSVVEVTETHELLPLREASTSMLPELKALLFARKPTTEPPIRPNAVINCFHVQVEVRKIP